MRRKREFGSRGLANSTLFVSLLKYQVIIGFISFVSIKFYTVPCITNYRSVYKWPIIVPLDSPSRTWLCFSSMLLRVRAFFHRTVRVCHVHCNFKIGFTCRITVIFGTLKDGSVLISTLASNICFSYRNMFQNGVDALSKIVDAFLSKSSKFHLVRIIR